MLIYTVKIVNMDAMIKIRGEVETCKADITDLCSELKRLIATGSTSHPARKPVANPIGIIGGDILRVIAGTAKGHPLIAPKGMDTRPITARIKEALFSIWQMRIAGSRFLDLFAGSG